MRTRCCWPGESVPMRAPACACMPTWASASVTRARSAAPGRRRSPSGGHEAGRHDLLHRGGERRVQDGALGDVAEAAPLAEARGVLAEEGHAAGRGREQAQHDAEQRGLPGSVRSDDAEEVARRHGQVDAVEHGHGAVAEPDVLQLDEGAHPRHRFRAAPGRAPRSASAREPAVAGRARRIRSDTSHQAAPAAHAVPSAQPADHVGRPVGAQLDAGASPTSTARMTATNARPAAWLTGRRRERPTRHTTTTANAAAAAACPLGKPADEVLGSRARQGGLQHGLDDGAGGQDAAARATSAGAASADSASRTRLAGQQHAPRASVVHRAGEDGAPVGASRPAWPRGDAASPGVSSGTAATTVSTARTARAREADGAPAAPGLRRGLGPAPGLAGVIDHGAHSTPHRPSRRTTASASRSAASGARDRKSPGSFTSTSIRRKPSRVSTPSIRA